MEETEKDHGERRLPGPSMAYQHGLQGRKIMHIRQSPCLQVGHKDNGQDDFIGREAKKESGQYDAVQPHETAQRIQKTCDKVKKAGGRIFRGESGPQGKPPGIVSPERAVVVSAS